MINERTFFKCPRLRPFVLVMSMERWWNDTDRKGGEQKCWEKKLSQYHFVCHKSHVMD